MARRIITNEEFLENMHAVHPTISVIGTYSKANVPVELRCNVCGNIWNAKPVNLLYQKMHGCPKCGHNKAGKSRRLSDSEFREKLREKKINLIPLEPYKTAIQKIRFMCPACRTDSYISPNNVLNGQGCPYCNSMSSAERYIMDYLDNRNFPYVYQYSFDDLLGTGGHKLKFDFAIKSISGELLLLIEYDGAYHFEPKRGEELFEMYKTHDQLKNNYCEKHGIKLIRIPYYRHIGLRDILDSIFRDYVIAGVLPDFPSEASKLFATLFE